MWWTTHIIKSVLEHDCSNLLYLRINTLNIPLSEFRFDNFYFVLKSAGNNPFWVLCYLGCIILHDIIYSIYHRHTHPWDTHPHYSPHRLWSVLILSSHIYPRTSQLQDPRNTQRTSYSCRDDERNSESLYCCIYPLKLENIMYLISWGDAPYTSQLDDTSKHREKY